MTGPRESALTAGFDVGRMLMLLDDARSLIEAGAGPGTDWGERAQGWLFDHAEWQHAEADRQAADTPRERIDRPEREREPTVLSTVRERDSGWHNGRELVEEARRRPGRYRPEHRDDQLGQAHIDVHNAWRTLGFAEGCRDGIHSVYGYPRGDAS